MQAGRQDNVTETFEVDGLKEFIRQVDWERAVHIFQQGNKMAAIHSRDSCRYVFVFCEK